jgi:hypothetical protein
VFRFEEEEEEAVDSLPMRSFQTIEESSEGKLGLSVGYGSKRM